MRPRDRAPDPGALDPLGDSVVEIMTLAQRPAWHRRAACRGWPQSWWFADRRNAEEGRRARAICAGCEVREPCGDYGIAHEPEHGTWGGTTPKERRAIRRDRAAS